MWAESQVSRGGSIRSLKHPVVIISILQFRKLQGGEGLTWAWDSQRERLTQNHVL